MDPKQHLRHEKQQQFAIILGTGMCGMQAAVDVFNRQIGCQASFRDLPVLPWNQTAHSAETVGHRIQRLRRKSTTANLLLDASTAYLSYVNEVMRLVPGCRILCLQRPCEEVVQKYQDFLFRNYQSPTTYWASSAPSGWQVDPVFSRQYPSLPATSLEEAIQAYWKLYVAESENFVKIYSDRFQIFDPAESLDTVAGLQRFLEFAGIPRQRQRLVTGRFAGEPQPMLKRLRPLPPGPRALISSAPARCVILVSFHSHISAGCDRSLKVLEERGYPVRRVAGFAAIDQARNQLVTDALIDGFEETFWISPEIEFHPDDVDRIRAYGVDLCCGWQGEPGSQLSETQPHPGQPTLLRLKYASSQFLHVRRTVYDRVLQQLQLPVCNERFKHPLIPFFMPMHLHQPAGTIYLDDIQAFSQRVATCGIPILADPSIRLSSSG